MSNVIMTEDRFISFAVTNTADDRGMIHRIRENLHIAKERDQG